MGDESKIRRTRRTAALAACVALPLLFGAIAYAASRTKSATMDEPLHAVGAWLHVFHGDFRINPEDPPLWNYWAMIPHSRASLQADFSDRDWPQSLQATDYQTRFTTRTLYQTATNNGSRFIQRSRAMMALLGVVLGWVIALYAWKLGGPVAAVVAVVLYSFDPNFLAHAPLVKNDVPISLLLLSVALALWSVVRRISWWNVVLLGLLCGTALTTKFSGIIVLPLILLILERPMIGGAWPVLGRKLTRGRDQVVAALALCLTCGLLSWGMIWLAYGFRNDPTPIAGSRLDLPFQIKAAMQNDFFRAHGRFADEKELREWPVPLAVRFAMLSERWKLLPHAYVHGFIYTYQTSLLRSAYLLGQVRTIGWWYYFPLAMLFKTPLATLAALGVMLATALWLIIARARGAPLQCESDTWGTAMLLSFAAAYGLIAVTSNLNLGVRHMLPVYPFLFILIGVCVGRHARRRPRVGLAASIVLAAALVVESLAAFPHYIPFFNAFAKPHRLHLLSDSNLDWGQDLPLVARWQRENPHERLYLCYFGSADPAFYGIDYINLPPGFWLGPPYQRPTSSGVVAISATYLQGVHMPQEMGDYYAPLRRQTPRAILGGSIYLYDYGPPQTENRP